jgi:proteasome component ECM29
MEPFLKDLWFRCFRVIDDIKESVRKAAMSMFRTLSSLSVRLCDPVYTNPDQGKEAIAVIMPFLLTEGLHSPVKEVLGLTVEQIQKICKGPLPSCSVTGATASEAVV